MLRCVDPRKTVDCWFCVVVRFLFFICLVLPLYYSPELFRLIDGEHVVFRPKLTKTIVPVLFFGSALVWSLYLDIQHFTKEKKKKKQQQ
jgi:hypothetical protein